jgi:hypothetical protein
VRIQLLAANLSDRFITADHYQKALYIEERRLCSEGPVGRADEWGSPRLGAGTATVQTCRIEQIIDARCGSKTCKEVHTGVTGKENVKDVYKKHTFMHEAYHNMKGVPRDIDADCVLDNTYVELSDHYPVASDPGASTVMEPQVTYKRGGTIKFYIPVNFADPDLLNAQHIDGPC